MRHCTIRREIDLRDGNSLHAVALATGAPVWRKARDERRPVLPALCLALAPHELTLFAPAVDSVMALGETCLRRPLCHGDQAGADAQLLCRLIADPNHIREIARSAPDGVLAVFRCALNSIRVLGSLAERR